MTQEPKEKSEKITTRFLLERELLRRKQLNPSYSVRSFAQFLGVNQTFLLRVLKGQRSLSEKLSLKICHRLGVSPEEFEKVASTQNNSYVSLTKEQFELLTDDLHFSMIEYLKLPNVSHETKNIAAAFSVSMDRVERTLRRLKNFEVIKPLRKKWKVLKSDLNWLNPQRSNVARKDLQKQMLLSGIEAIDNIDFGKRYNASLTTQCSQKILPEVQRRIREFQIDLDSFISSNSDHKDVYQMVTAFFPVTHLEESEVK